MNISRSKPEHYFRNWNHNRVSKSNHGKTSIAKKVLCTCWWSLVSFYPGDTLRTVVDSSVVAGHVELTQFVPGLAAVFLFRVPGSDGRQLWRVQRSCKVLITICHERRKAHLIDGLQVSIVDALHAEGPTMQEIRLILNLQQKKPSVYPRYTPLAPPPPPPPPRAPSRITFFSMSHEK